MKTSNPIKALRIVLFFFLILFIILMTPSPSGDALESGAGIGATAFQPGMMIFLGSGLIGLAGWGLKKFRK